MDEDVYLKVNGFGEIRADVASLVLSRVSEAYRGLQVLNNLKDVQWANYRGRLEGLRYEAYQSIWLEPDNKPETTDLVMTKVILASPGNWEFLGKWNPLEVIRQYLVDRHERRKDISYRNSLEKERLEIENAVLKTRLISEAVNIAQGAGMSDVELTALLRDNAIIPLMRLDVLQDINAVTDAEIIAKSKVLESETEKEPA